MILLEDDQLNTSYISRTVGLFASVPVVTVGLGQQAAITEHVLGLLPSLPSTQAEQIFDGLEFLTRTLAGGLRSNVITYISRFARRADVFEVGGFKQYPDGSYAENFLLWGLTLRGRVTFGANRMLYRVYAMSHGLSNPFSSLPAATHSYSRNCTDALRAATGLSASYRARLIKVLKRSSLAMLIGRIRKVYAKRVSKLEVAYYTLATAIYALTPSRFL